jgi:hypothetical protein
VREVLALAVAMMEPVSMDSAADQLFGEIAIRLFFCTRRDLDRSLRAQAEAREAGSDPPLGEILRALGVLNQEQVDTVLKTQEVFDVTNVETLYGRIALRNRFIRPADLEDANKVQAKTGRRLRMGEILVKRGYITWEQHESILRLQERLLRQMEKKKGPDLDSLPPPPPPPADVVPPPAKPRKG